MEVIVIESQTFQEILTMYQRVCGLLEEELREKKKRNDKLLLSAREVAEMTGYNEKTIRLKKHEIGFFTIGKEVMFKPADVEAWIEQSYIRPRPQGTKKILI